MSNTITNGLSTPLSRNLSSFYIIGFSSFLASVEVEKVQHCNWILGLNYKDWIQAWYIRCIIN